MGRLGITYEDVASAAEDLLSAGESITIERVRFALGNTGSNSVISKHLQAWKQQRLHTKPSAGKLSDPLQKTVAAIWEQVRAESTAENERLRAESQQAISAAQQENQAAVKEAQQSREALEKANLKINRLETDFQLLKKELVQEHQRGEVEAVRANKAEELANKIQLETKSHIEDLKQSYDSNIKAANEQREKDKADFRTDLTQFKDLLEKQRGENIAQVDKYKTAHEQAIKQLAQVEAELKRQRELAENWMQKAKALEVDLTVANEQINTLSKERAILGKRRG